MQSKKLQKESNEPQVVNQRGEKIACIHSKRVLEFERKLHFKNRLWKRCSKLKARLVHAHTRCRTLLG